MLQPRKISLAACIMRWPSTTRRPWWSHGWAKVTSNTEPVALELQDERLAATALQQHNEASGPTLPTPTTLWAMSTMWNRPSAW
jgi:hypothetical protein